MFFLESICSYHCNLNMSRNSNWTSACFGGKIHVDAWILIFIGSDSLWVCVVSLQTPRLTFWLNG